MNPTLLEQPALPRRQDETPAQRPGTSPPLFVSALLILAGILLFHAREQAFLRQLPWEYRTVLLPITMGLLWSGLAGTLLTLRGGWLPKGPGVARLPATAWLGVLAAAAGSSGLLTRGLPNEYDFGATLLLLLGMGMMLFGLLRPELPTSAGQTAPRVSLTRPGLFSVLMVIVLLAGAYLGPSNMLMLVFALTVGPFVVNGWFSLATLRGLTLTRELPAQIMAGEPLTVTLCVTNRKSFSAWLLTLDDTITTAAGPRFDRLWPSTMISRVPARETFGASYRVCLAARGRYRFGPVRIRSKFPLGLIERALKLPAVDHLIVTPRIGQLTPRWRIDAAAEEPVQRQRPRQGAFQDEFEKLRDYRPGDNPRMIHWRTSARLGTLAVREYREVRDRDLLLLLDLDAAAPQEALERAISFAATLLLDHVRRSRHSGIALAVAGSKFTTWQGTATPAALEPLLERLALAAASAAPDRAALWEFAQTHRTAGTAGVLVISHPAANAHQNAPPWLKRVPVDASLGEFYQLED